MESSCTQSKHISFNRRHR
jgi:hypothetical protein